MIRLNWPVAILAAAFIALIARRPRLVLSRAFFPVILVVAIVLLVSYVRRPKRPGSRK